MRLTNYSAFPILFFISMAFVSAPVLGADTTHTIASKPSTDDQKYCEACHQVLKMIHDGRALGANPEKELGTQDDLELLYKKYNFTNHAISKLHGMQGYIAQVSLVDFDNDGINELRITFRTGSALCEDNFFFKKKQEGPFDSVKIKGIDLTGGRLCRGGSLSFIRYGNQNYLLLSSSPDISPEALELYSANLEGFHYECTIRPSSNKIESSPQ